MVRGVNSKEIEHERESCLWPGKNTVLAGIVAAERCTSLEYDRQGESLPIYRA